MSVSPVIQPDMTDHELVQRLRALPLNEKRLIARLAEDPLQPDSAARVMKALEVQQ